MTTSRWSPTTPANESRKRVLVPRALAAGTALLFLVAAGASAQTPIPRCLGLTATMVGTEGNDVLTGTDGDDVIVGLGGDDIINGGPIGIGGDSLCGEKGTTR